MHKKQSEGFEKGEVKGQNRLMCCLLCLVCVCALLEDEQACGSLLQLLVRFTEQPSSILCKTRIRDRRLKRILASPYFRLN